MVQQCKLNELYFLLSFDFLLNFEFERGKSYVLLNNLFVQLTVDRFPDFGFPLAELFELRFRLHYLGEGEGVLLVGDPG
jgi:hypothetical protein